MTIMQSLYFCYDGKYSSDYGLINVTMQSGLYDEGFAPSRSISETTIKGSNKPYFQGVTYEPISLKLTFAFEAGWDSQTIKEIKRWLVQDYYKPLWFSDNPNQIYYCLMVDDARHLHNGLEEGYITLTMRCDSPFTYSSANLSEKFQVSDSSSVILENYGDVICKPEVFIKKIGNGGFSITNQTNGGSVSAFTDLIDGESLYVDCENECIETDLANTYRYGNFNNWYLELVTGSNTLSINGNAEVQFRYIFRNYQN